MNDEVPSRLDILDQDEWWDVCRELQPEMTREEFEQLWEFFQHYKFLYTLH